MKYNKGNKNFKIAVLFFIAVFFLIAISLIFKAILLIKDSSFDGKNRFTVSVFEKNKIAVVSFSPSSKSISILQIEGGVRDKNIGRLLEVPVDGYVILENSNLNKNNITKEVPGLVFNLGKIKTDLTILDLLRVGLFAKGVSMSSIAEKTIKGNSDYTLIQLAVSTFFVDPKIAEEKITIEVINATGERGLANRLADFVVNMGGDVVLVSTGDVIQNQSKILYSGNKNYTISKISKILNFKLEKSKKKEISDVIIVIGRDSLTNIKF